MHKLQFPPLNSLRREIRILKPLAWQEPILHDNNQENATGKDITLSGRFDLEFELKVVSIDDAPKYNALSYVWGTLEATKPIIVNGQELLVTENLDFALRHIEYANLSPAIWIDAICINQANNVERTEQVRLMKSIYSSAIGVVVWLGPPTEKSDFIINATESFVARIVSRFNVPNPRKYQLLDYLEFDTSSDVMEFMQSAINSSTNNTEKNTVLAKFVNDFLAFITTRAWWYRIWVLQEFVFARQVCFQVGKRRLDREGLSALFMCIMHLQTNSILERGIWDQGSRDMLGQQGGHDWIMNMLACRERYSGSYGSRADYKVFDLLCTIYFRPPWHAGERFLPRSSDRRDQIYGLVGLFEDEYRNLGLEIDYRHGWQEVYCDIAQKFIEAGNLDVLSFCQAEKHSLLPSWVPIWHEFIETPNGWFKSGKQGSEVLGNSLFDAAFTAKVDVSFTVCESQTFPLRSMHVTGTLFDVVTDVKSVYAKSRATSLKDRELLFGRLFREIEFLCEQSRISGFQTYTPEFLSEAAWRMPAWDHELISNDEKDEVRRATQTTLDRYNACLPLFKAVEKYMASEGAHDGDLSSHPIMNIRQFLTSEVNTYLLAIETGRPMRPFMTKSGYIGLGPMTLQPDDVVSVFHGARIPYILRSRGHGKNGYTFVGEAFVYGLMDGEVLNLGRKPVKIEIF